MIGMLGVLGAVAGDPTIVFEPTDVVAFPLHGDPRCGVHLQVQCGADKPWTRWLVDSAMCGEEALFPPEPDLWPDVGGKGTKLRWRVANAAGTVVSEFRGPWLVDADALASVLGFPVNQRTPRDCAEPRKLGVSCRTAFDVMFALGEFQERSCVGRSD